MTSTNTATSYTGTLVANTADTVRFTAAWDAIKITNSGTTAIYYRADDGTATVAGTGSNVLLPGQATYVIQYFDNGGSNSLVKVTLISTGTPSYTVAGVNLPTNAVAYALATLLAGSYLPLAGSSSDGTSNSLYGPLVFGATSTTGGIGLARVDDGLLVLSTIADRECYLEIYGHGNAAGDYPNVLLFRSRSGTTGVSNNDVLGRFIVNARDSVPTDSVAGYLEFFANQTWTGTKHGTTVRLLACPADSITPATAFSFNGTTFTISAPAAIFTGTATTAGRRTTLASIAVAQSPYTFPATIETLCVDTSGGNVAVTLPAHAAGQCVEIVKTTTDTNSITLTPTSGNISGSATLAWNTAYAAYTLRSDGTNWWII